jgi:hypothetical protein
MPCAAKDGSWTAAQCAWTLATTLHIRRYAQPGKSRVGEQHGQEIPKEIEEDQPDQAVDENSLVQVGSIFWWLRRLVRYPAQTIRPV